MEEQSISDFKAHGMLSMLSALSLPNGGINISLMKLYNAIQYEWKINNRYIDIGHVVAVIAFGSAVQYPGYVEQKAQRKEYFFFGPLTERIKRSPIKPNDVDFLVVTKENLTDDKFIDSRISYDYGNDHCRREGNIHLVPRGINQVLNGVGNSYRSMDYEVADTVSESALRYGVPLFYDKEVLEDLVRRAGITKETPRKVLWKKDWEERLVGKIR